MDQSAATAASPIPVPAPAPVRTAAPAPTRAELLAQGLAIVRRTAFRLVRRLPPNVELDDLVSAGTEGLLRVLDRYDPGRCPCFEAFAAARIRGAILDELRARDWRPRSVRAKGRQLAAVVSALQTRYGRAPDAQEVAEAMGIDLITYYRLKEDVDGGVMVSLAGTVARGGDDALRLEETLADPEGEAGIQAIGKADTLRRLREGIAQLPPRERTVLSLYYYEELNLKEIAVILHVTESRVSQIRSQAIRRLRDQSVITTEDA